VVPYLFGFDLSTMKPGEGAHGQVTVMLLKVTTGADVPQLPLLRRPMPN
jgi:hypothetical protein